MLAAPVKPVQPYEALPEEKEAVIAYALRHPELRHRELAWRMWRLAREVERAAGGAGAGPGQPAP